MNDTLKIRLTHLTPIIVSLAFGVLCAHLLSSTPIELQGITPFQEGIGSLGNALYFVVLVGIGATLLYLLLKRGSHKLITMITGFALTTAVFMLSTVYLVALSSTYNILNTDSSILILSLAITILADYLIFRTHGKTSNAVVVVLGGALGAFLGSTIPILSAIFILTLLAVYDVFAVYHGPVGKIARTGLEHLRGLSFSFRDVQMGLGDLTFYSMLIGRVFVSSGPFFCLASAIGVLAGVYLAFKMLEKKGMFPGLPFPIALGLMPFVVFLFLQL